MTFSWTSTPIGWVLLAIFVVAYALVVFEERLELRKSKPCCSRPADVGPVAFQALRYGGGTGAGHTLFREVFVDFAELFFFLIVAMSYVTAIGERNVFESMRAELASRRLSYRALFWCTGVLAFFLSAALDNSPPRWSWPRWCWRSRATTTASWPGCINLVVAANAGAPGARSATSPR
jgi:hypothetical protein